MDDTLQVWSVGGSCLFYAYDGELHGFAVDGLFDDVTFFFGVVDCQTPSFSSLTGSVSGHGCVRLSE